MSLFVQVRLILDPFLLFQRVPPAQAGRESGPHQRADGQRQRLCVSRAQEDGAIRFGLSPQRTDLRGEETGGGGLLQWGPLSADLHLHSSCRDQPPCSQVSHRVTEEVEFMLKNSHICIFFFKKKQNSYLSIVDLPQWALST